MDNKKDGIIAKIETLSLPELLYKATKDDLAMGISISQIAKQCKMNSQPFASAMNGTTIPKLSTAKGLAELIGIDEKTMAHILTAVREIKNIEKAMATLNRIVSNNPSLKTLIQNRLDAETKLSEHKDDF